MEKNVNKIFWFSLMMTTVIFTLLSSSISVWADSPPETCSVGIFGTGDGEFQNPYGLAVDENRGCIYICDTGNNKIKKLSLFGEYRNSFGGPGSADGQFLHPQGVGVDSANGNVYVADTVNQRIQKFDANNAFLLKFGSFGNQNGQFNLPRDIAIDSQNNVYVCDSGNNRISKFTSSGTFSANIGQSSSLKNPYGIDVDSTGNIYVADTENHRIVKFAPDGTKSMEFGSYGTQPGQFRFPHDVVVDKSGNIYVADTDNYRIQKFDAQGSYINSFGVFLDFLSPQKLAIDSNDNLYVIDSNTNKLKVYNVSIYIGNLSIAPSPFSPDGDGFQDSTFISYTIPEPTNITINIYDEQGNLVRNLIEGASRLTANNTEEWDGKDNTGVFVNAGTYTFKIDAVNAVNYHAPQRSCEASVYYSKGEISGIVTDWNNPLSNVAVSDGTRVTLTGPDGTYTIKNVPIGAYTITANKNDYVSKNQQVTISAEGQKITGVDFVLDPSAPTKGKISGRVTYGVTPLQGVSVSDGTRSSQTDANGNYVIADIPAGTYTLTAGKDGYKVSYKTITMGSGGILINIDFTLEESNEPDIRVTPATLQFEVKSGQSVSSMSSAQSLQSGLSTSISSQTIKSSSSSSALQGNVIPGEYIIKFKRGVSRKAQQDAIAGIDAVSVKENQVHAAHLIRHSKITPKTLAAAKNKPTELKQMEADLTGFGSAMTNLAVSKSDLIEYVEPNREVHVLGSGTSTPNDTYFANQWGPQKIAAPDAWAIEAGERNIIVAVIDSGVDYTHNDLSANYLPGGYDFVDDDNDPYPAADGIDNNQNGWVDEGVNHGTHVAGIIAAVANNSIGIAGIAKVSILSERVMNSDGDGTSFDVVEGINHAVAHGAKIINLSLGGGRTSLESDACQNAWDNGCIIVAAAGNDYGGPVSYPAAYPTVIAVSATDSNDNLSNFSSVGSEVELSAPGVSILSTIKNNQYETESGTSMAAPHVAGVAALVWSANPGFTNEEVRKVLQDSADDLGPSGRDDNFGYGRVNAYKAILNSAGLCQSQAITIYNDGGVSLVVTNVTNTYSWISVDKTSFTINPGCSTIVNVKVVSAGVNPGIYNDTIKIYSNDPDKNPYLVPIGIIIGAKPGGVTWQKENAAMVGGAYMSGAYAGGIRAATPVFIDIDHDGDYDMFTGNQDGTISFYRNDGTATSPSWTFVTGNYNSIDVGDRSAPVFVDIDNDGDYDMFIGNQDGKIAFYRNDGTATSPSWTFVTGNYNSIDVGDRSAPVFVDIDNDGDYDMFIGNQDGKIAFYRNDGTATSPSWTFVTANYNSIDVGDDSKPVFIDIDNDGDKDLFIGDATGGVSFYRNMAIAGNTSPIISLPDTSLDKNATIDLWNYSYDAETPSSLLAYSITANTRPECAVTIRSNRFIDIYPQSGWYGSSDVTVRAMDLGGVYAEDTFHVTVTHANNPPIITPSVPNPTAVDEDTPITIKLTSYKTDVEDSGVNLKWSVLGVQHCTVSGQNSADDTLTFTPEANYNGHVTVTLVLTDSGGATATQDIMLTWNPVNDPPVVSAIPDKTINEGDSIMFVDLDDYVMDPDNAKSELTWTCLGNNKVGVSIDPVTHVVTLNSQAGWQGNETLTFTAKDPGGLSSSATSKVTVANRYGYVSGVVKNDISGLPIASIWVRAYDWTTNQLVSSVQTISDGTYKLNSLLPGDYRVCADTTGMDYVSKYYNNVETASFATKVPVALGVEIKAIDFALPVLEQISVNFHVDFNEIGFAVLPQNLPSPYKASDFVDDLASQGVRANTVMQWDGAMWISHRFDLPFTDFNLNLDQGIFVSAMSDTYNAGTWTIKGRKIKLPKVFNLTEGWTLVSVPTTISTATVVQTLQQINAQGGTADVMMWWDGAMWVSSQVDLPFTDQQLVKGRSYFIRCIHNSIWRIE